MPFMTKENETEVEMRRNGFFDASDIGRILVILFAAFVLIRTSSVFEEEYHAQLIDLYTSPWWRMLLVLFVIASAAWCPQVGIIVALVVFFYLSDMNTLLLPVSHLG